MFVVKKHTTHQYVQWPKKRKSISKSHVLIYRNNDVYYPQVTPGETLKVNKVSFIFPDRTQTNISRRRTLWTLHDNGKNVLLEALVPIGNKTVTCFLIYNS